MRARVLRHPLGGGFAATRAHAAVIGDRTDSVWLDTGDDGVSYLATGTRVPLDRPLLPALRRALDELGRVDPAPDDGPEPAFALGLVGWLGYEARGETTGAEVARRGGHPDAAFLAVDRAVAIDGRTGEAELLALTSDGSSDDDGWPSALAEWRDATAAALRASRSGPDPTEPLTTPTPVTGRWRHPAARYLAMIEECRAAIREGEAYQLCLTTAVDVDARPDPVELYHRVRATSPTHHGALLRIGGTALVSASPERFLAVGGDGTLTTSPIKGTRPRGGDPDRDAELAAELEGSGKERAENLMIVDLMRNDLSRVCEPSTVEVTRLLGVESYAQVHQLVSTVRGTLRPGLDAVDAIAACFPAGSMTGAPKRRATELLDRIEGSPRGPYAGAFGYLGVDGQADFAMTIRTVVLDGASASVGTGGGITALSIAEEELEETVIKAAPLLAALGAVAPLS